MIEGSYLGRPPVDVPGAARRQLTGSLLRGVSAYSMGAGGFGNVPAMPFVQNFHRPPAAPNRDVRMVELYRMQPGLFKQRLQQQFAPKARPNGYIPPAPTLSS